jgi:hypothetical protein
VPLNHDCGVSPCICTDGVSAVFFAHLSLSGTQPTARLWLRRCPGSRCCVIQWAVTVALVLGSHAKACCVDRSGGSLLTLKDRLPPVAAAHDVVKGGPKTQRELAAASLNTMLHVHGLTTRAAQLRLLLPMALHRLIALLTWCCIPKQTPFSVVLETHSSFCQLTPELLGIFLPRLVCQHVL